MTLAAICACCELSAFSTAGGIDTPAGRVSPRAARTLIRSKPLRATGPDGEGFPGVGVVEREEGAGEVPSEAFELELVASLISVAERVSWGRRKRKKATHSFRVSSQTWYIDEGVSFDAFTREIGQVLRHRRPTWPTYRTRDISLERAGENEFMKNRGAWLLKERVATEVAKETDAKPRQDHQVFTTR